MPEQPESAPRERREVTTFCGGTAAVYSRACPGADAENEDCAALLPVNGSRGVLCVADGAGGLPCGARASRLAVDALRASLVVSAHEDAGLREAVLRGFDMANLAVTGIGLGSATTLVAVTLDAGSARTYHVGDSAALITGQRRRRKLETVMHSPVGYALAAGMIDGKEALVHEDRHLVSNLVGLEGMKVEMSVRVDLAARDTVVVASDGLMDNVAADDIVEITRKGPLDEAMDRLAQLALRRMATPAGKPDDLTFILFRRGPY